MRRLLQWSGRIVFRTPSVAFSTLRALHRFKRHVPCKVESFLAQFHFHDSLEEENSSSIFVSRLRPLSAREKLNPPL